MVPETYEAKEVRLYKARSFPFEWEYSKSILDEGCVDSTIFYKKNTWWMFTCDNPQEHNSLRLFYTNDLNSSWNEHPASPIYKENNRGSRPGGKVFNYQNRLYRIAQDCAPFYGHSIRAFEIIEMDKEIYIESEIDENPILYKGSSDWNRVSMHHLDLHETGQDKFIAFVDGRAN